MTYLLYGLLRLVSHFYEFRVKCLEFRVVVSVELKVLRLFGAFDVNHPTDSEVQLGFDGYSKAIL